MDIDVKVFAGLLLLAFGCVDSAENRNTAVCEERLRLAYQQFRSNLTTSSHTDSDVIPLSDAGFEAIICPLCQESSCLRVAPCVSKKALFGKWSMNDAEVLVCHSPGVLHGSKHNLAGLLLSDGRVMFSEVASDQFKSWSESLPSDAPWKCPSDFLSK